MQSVKVAGHCWVKKWVAAQPKDPWGEFGSIWAAGPSGALQKGPWPAKCLQQPTGVMIGIEASAGGVVLKNTVQPLILMGTFKM